MAGGYWHISPQNLKRFNGDPNAYGVYNIGKPCPNIIKINEYDEEYPAFSVYKPLLLDLDETVEVLIDGTTKSHLGKLAAYFQFEDMTNDGQMHHFAIGTIANITYFCDLNMDDYGDVWVTFTGATGSA